MKNFMQHIVKTLFLFSIFFSLSSAFAQAPQKMSYQAVIRDTGNTLISNAAVGMKISILQGSTSGTAVYEENHTSTTNLNGLATLEIGNGTPVSGTFSAINWSAGPYFVKTETDPTGGTSYTITGTSQLMTVPYAMYATTSGNSNNTWGLTGNAGTNSTTNFIGTSDNNDLVFKRNNIPAGKITASNTAIGSLALLNNTGLGNTAIGTESLKNVTTGLFNIGIGFNSQVPNPAGASQLSIGNVIYGSEMGSTENGKIGIGTTNPTTKLEVNGFTKLGTDAPKIKMKTLTGFSGSSETGYNRISIIFHNIDTSKILLTQILLDKGSGSYIHENYTVFQGYQFDYDITPSQINIYNIENNSYQILSKPIKILITYEE